MFLRSRYGSAALILVLGSCTASQAISKDVPTPNDVGPRPAPSLDAAAPPPTFLPRRTLRPSQRDATRAPVSLTASDGTGLKLVSLTARAVVEEPLAFTELHLVFENPTDRRIEGRFEIEMPPNAAISRFAMLIGGHWQEGEVVERARPSAPTRTSCTASRTRRCSRTTPATPSARGCSRSARASASS
jgi:hypothetical protein